MRSMSHRAVAVLTTRVPLLHTLRNAGPASSSCARSGTKWNVVASNSNIPTLATGTWQVLLTLRATHGSGARGPTAHAEPVNGPTGSRARGSPRLFIRAFFIAALLPLVSVRIGASYSGCHSSIGLPSGSYRRANSPTPG